ncbi:hypothetical protein BABINDRAFT_24986, partial [Babjeviella inositovora NRRL Y-12698]
KINRLLAWAKEHGTVIDPSISFAYSANKGISAYRLTVSGNKEIELPVTLAMTPEQAIAEFGVEFLDQCSAAQLNINAIGKLFFLKERAKADSFYHPYITSLPSLVEIGSPLSWSTAEKAYLKGTNLGSSLFEKFQSAVNEWQSVMALLQGTETLSAADSAQLASNLEFADVFAKSAAGHDYSAYLKEQSEDANNWTSFANYLYASLIYTSRAFPYYLVDAKKCRQGQAILLPIIDLLNHETGAKVEWGCADNVFSFTNLSENGNLELCNNYGLKGNEELLLGYGFTLSSNSQANSVALRIKLPIESLGEVETVYGIRLPDMNDYTSFATKLTAHSDYSKYADGLLYFITESIIPDSLINLFAYLVRNDWEQSGDITLRMKLDGLAKLRTALEQKITVASQHFQRSQASDNRNITNALIYRDSQLKVYNKAIKIIKHLEKTLLTKYKSQLVSLSKILKKDVPFVEALARTMGMEGLEDVEASQAQDQVMIMWLVRCFNKDQYEEGYCPEWIRRAFNKLAGEYKVQSEDVAEYQPLYQFLFPKLANEAPEIFGKGIWTVKELIIAGKLMGTVSYTRSNDDVVLVEDGV